MAGFSSGFDDLKANHLKGRRTMRTTIGVFIVQKYVVRCTSKYNVHHDVYAILANV
jgi:hypothetical protein